MLKDEWVLYKIKFENGGFDPGFTMARSEFPPRVIKLLTLGINDKTPWQGRGKSREEGG